MITAVDLLRGLGAMVGWDRIEVDGATGYLDTNYAGKGKAAIEALKLYDVGLRPYRGTRRSKSRRSRR